MGYYRAGFDIVGVDTAPQKRYPFEFIQADALVFLDMYGAGFDAIHASPPCQAYTKLKALTKKLRPELVPATRYFLKKTGRPYIIENVPGAPLIDPVMLCGASFGLGASGFDLPRHRLFESNTKLKGLKCCHRKGQTLGVYGNGTNKWHRELFGRCITIAEMREAMGIPWMTRKELSQAIPPAYTEWLGKQLLAALPPTY